MSQLEKLLQRIRNNPRTVTFEELDKILRKNGYERRQPGGGSSHYTYRKKGKLPLTVLKKSPYVKEEYVKQVIEVLDNDRDSIFHFGVRCWRREIMKKDLEYYLSLPYQEVIKADKEGGYVGYIPELKGCITQAETKAEILEMLEDAKKCWIEAALEDGVEIPEPVTDEDFSGRFNLRIPKSLHRQLAMSAKEEGVSLNQLAMCLLANGLRVPLTK